MYRLTNYIITRRSDQPNLGNYAVSLVQGELRIAAASQLGNYVSMRPHYRLKDQPETECDFTLEIASGRNYRGWYGENGSLFASYDDSNVTITITATVSRNDVEIQVDTTNKVQANIEVEGVRLRGDTNFLHRENSVIEGDYLHADGADGIYTFNGDVLQKRVVLDGSVTYIGDQQRSAGTSKSVTIKTFNSQSELAPVRLLNQPSGYNAGLTISNHGHDNFLDSVKAVHFGSSDENAADYGIKGLSGRGIKTTWSVYYESEPWAPGFDDPDQLQLMLELQAAGQEICPHTTWTSGEHRTRAINNLPPYENNFNSKTWIDHGLGAGASTSGLASRGWDSSDMEYYILDLLEDYGYTNAWNYQDLDGIDRIGDNILGFAHKLLYQSRYLLKPNSGDPIWLWPSNNRPFALKTLTATTLQDLIDECGSCDAHDYFTFDGNEANGADDDGFFYQDGANKLITNTLDDLLVTIKLKVDAGQLWNPTCGEWADYNAMLKSVSVFNHAPGQFDVSNQNATTVQGCTFLIGKHNIQPKLNGVSMNTKSVKKGTIAWADLPVSVSNISY